MAKQISKSVVDAERPQRYPWDKWSNGRWWEAAHGEDFLTEPDVFRRQINNYARYHGAHAETTVSGSKVRFRIVANK